MSQRNESTTPENTTRYDGDASTLSCTANSCDDSELDAVIAAWPDLPDAVRAGILAMVRASAGDQS